VRDGLRSLRSGNVSDAVGKAIRAGKVRNGFRITHFSIQSNHLHFIVEAEGKKELADGIRGLAIRLAHAINKALDRKGKVFPDRYDARAMTCPRDVRNTIRYVLANNKVCREWRRQLPVRVRSEELSVRLGSYLDGREGDRSVEAPGTEVHFQVDQQACGPQRE